MRLNRVAWLVGALLFAAALALGFTAWNGGYRAYVIHTGSMVHTLVPGDLIIDGPPTPGHYQKGEIITFRHSKGPDLVTHRIHDLTPRGIHTKGDANRTADVWTIPQSMVEGVFRARVPLMGYVVVYLKQPAGAASIVTSAVGLSLLWGLFFSDEDGGPTPNDEARELEPREPLTV